MVGDKVIELQNDSIEGTERLKEIWMRMEENKKKALSRIEALVNNCLNSMDKGELITFKRLGDE